MGRKHNGSLRAGIKLDHALLPLLVLIKRLEPIGVVELTDRVGRDYTTISRQVAKLHELDLIDCKESTADKRVREGIVMLKGQSMTTRIDAAREWIGRPIFESWSEQDVDGLLRLMRKFADAIQNDPGKDTETG
ncbi:MarR family winged helix-turn-helix transcriptional regulator [Acidocella aminolytica]|uniref:Transcriptional regulator MarR family n=1 Tax=Acidocella aminolytica 101 = DSM 11237 TaxID=1120923 RepID=A0A0D6PIQ0_9PROT|nr:MarR family winged helix-turn-helix transcriptional regulator [Acidocella aminolytica]GAN81098.1 transcriptional regulator MarR family [Acidocella aminolytica 101 = DSM 11237]GBQ32792.1 MarR family transcriptional regulator [Acidocella aminolytica 101 = DSM 11237]SHF48713.1 DNA-binding transcriptional regulator, MarR family [Acidocella aminolytica 101 = DSM 11237]